jgi:hypothetical protein
MLMHTQVITPTEKVVALTIDHLALRLARLFRKPCWLLLDSVLIAEPTSFAC